MKIAYEEKTFKADTLSVINKANVILDEYEKQGFDLTLRQLYYQFVARGIIENSDKSYKRLGSIVNDGRLAGLIDWDRIEDRGRNLRGFYHYQHEAHAIKELVSDFCIDKWAGQPNRPEVWVEKEALVGVIERACNAEDVNFFACKGYVSQSEMWAAGMRLKRTQGRGQRPVVIHLGDHDPSGIDMTRDIRDRLELFVGGSVEVDRIALNMAQVEQYNPPPNPAKLTDSRCDGYIRMFGNKSWELDALDPSTLSALIADRIARVRDDTQWDAAVEKETRMKSNLEATSTHWTAVQEYVASVR